MENSHFFNLVSLLFFCRWKEPTRRVAGVQVFGMLFHTLRVILSLFFNKLITNSSMTSFGLMWMNFIFCIFWNLFVRPFILLGKIIDKSNGDVAVDQYHRYKVSNNVLSDSQLFYSFVVDCPCSAYIVISPVLDTYNIIMLVRDLSLLSSGCTMCPVGYLTYLIPIPNLRETPYTVKKHLS